MAEFVDGLIDSGLLQFGTFQQNGGHVPFNLRLDLLPSYPQLLLQAASEVTRLIASPKPDRLVCTHEAVALAVLVGQALNIPLVVHSGALGNPVRSLVGAYDIGHPAVLITLTNNLQADFIARLVTDAAGVGLHLTQWLSLVQTGPTTGHYSGAPLTMEDAADYLFRRGELRKSLAMQVIHSVR